MNNKLGFTLVELLATLVVLAIVLSIGAYSIINIIKSSKTENYNVLVKNIKSAAETYYQECKYDNKNAISNGLSCDNTGGTYTLTLSEMVQYGYLTSNDGDTGLKNPKNDDDIGNCKIAISYSNGVVNVVKADSQEKCPTY